MNIELLLEKQRAFFNSGTTRSIAWRKQQLRILKKAIIDYKGEILSALQTDVGKSSHDADINEVYICLKEIDYFIKNITCLAQPQRVRTPWYLWPSASSIHYEPYGLTLIMAPWNYPFQLCVMPLIGAMAAGNCALIKPSEFAPHTSQVIFNLITQTFDPMYIGCVQGDSKTAQALLSHKFDYIFFTGGTSIGKLVMKAAAEHLTQLTLELGGKNPCFVDSDVDIKQCAQRIITRKISNAGQSCIAPNSVFIHRSKKSGFIHSLIELCKQQEAAFGRIINEHHFDRLVALLSTANIIYGGHHDRSNLFIEPTLVELDERYALHPLMQEEIFGPILPIIPYNDIDEVITYQIQQPKPLAIYIFSNNHCFQEKIISRTSSGGVCINDCGSQFANLDLPFGGVGDSGFGRYHRKASFVTFSNQKSVLRTCRFNLWNWCNKRWINKKR